MNLDEQAFFAAVERRRRQEGLSWRELGRQLSLSPSTFSRLSRGSRPDLDTFLALVGWLGLPAETFTHDPVESAKRAVGTLDALSRSLRVDPTLDEEAAAALEDLFRVAYRRLSQPSV